MSFLVPSRQVKPYVHQEYPKFVEHATEPARVVKDLAAHQALGPGWGLDDAPSVQEAENAPVTTKKRKAKDTE